MAKMLREQAVRERRARKQARKQERKDDKIRAAAGLSDTGESTPPAQDADGEPASSTE